jgi:hypothetical protein
MANGLLASADITSANVDTMLYQPTAAKTGSFSVSLANRTSGIINIRIALTTTGSVSNQAYIIYDLPLYPNEAYERSGLALVSGQYIYVRASAVGVSALVWGYED